MKNLLLKSKTLLNVLFILMVTLTGSVTLLTACSEDDDTTQNLSNTWMKSASDEVELEIGVRTPVNLLFKDAVAEKLEYTCTSSDAAVATAALSKGNKTVTIEGLAEGTADIKIAYASSALDNLTATITVTVSKPSGDYEAEYADNGRWMKAAVEKAEVNIDEETPVALIFSDDEMKALEYECKSFDEAVAIATGFSMDADNNKIVNVKGVKVGTTKVKIQYWKPLEGGGRRIIRCLSDTIEVSVKDRLAGATMTLAKEEMKLKPSEEMQIPMIFGTEETIIASDYICTPSDEAIATAEVKEVEGKLFLAVKAKVDGETTIKVEYNRNGRKNAALSGDIKIKVVNGLTRVLTIGNSFSQDAVEQYLYELAEAAGQDLVIGSMVIGGCDLDKHWTNMQNDNADYFYRKIDRRVDNGEKKETKDYKLSQALVDEKWDYISLQQVSGKSGLYETYTNLPNLIASVKKVRPDANIVLHQTWAYASNSTHSDFKNYNQNQNAMYTAIVETVNKAKSDNPEITMIVPSGTAIQNGRTSYLGDTFNRPDGTMYYHLETTYGRYTAACTWFSALLGDVRHNTYQPETVNDNQAKIARQSAYAAIQEPDKVTDMSRYDPPISFESPVYVDFGSGKSSSPWNNVTISAATVPVTLVDANGNNTGLKLTVSNDFENYEGHGGKNEATIEEIVFPTAVWNDGLLVKEENAKGTVTISHLDPAASYNFMIQVARYNSNNMEARKSLISLNGGDVRTVQQAVSTTAPNRPTVDNTTTFIGITPTEEGLVVIEIGAGGTLFEGRINSLVITPILND